MSLATKIYFCRDKILVTTNTQNLCRDTKRTCRSSRQWYGAEVFPRSMQVSQARCPIVSSVRTETNSFLSSVRTETNSFLSSVRTETSSCLSSVRTETSCCLLSELRQTGFCLLSELRQAPFCLLSKLAHREFNVHSVESSVKPAINNV